MTPARERYYRERVLTAKQRNALRHWSRTPKRPVRIEGATAFISLTRGQEVAIDVSDLEMVSQYRWHAVQKRTTVYAGTLRTAVIPASKRGVLLLHNFLLKPQDGAVVDHIDCDGLNCRRSNLRVATIAQNTANSRRRSDNKSGFKGVCWSRPGKCWRAYIRSGGKQIHLGYFQNAEDAHAAYVAKASRVYGDFARAG